MELDDLKKTWKENTLKKPSNKNIMEMIQHKSYGPVAALRRSYKKQMIAMALMPILILVTNFNNIDSALSSIMYWSYVLFSAGIVFYAFNNYRVAGRMQSMDSAVKENLEKQLTILQTRLEWKIVGLRVAVIFFILLTEILPYFQHYKMLDTWHSLPVLVRFGTYAAFIIFQYFLSRLVIHRQFRRHLNYLQKLVDEME